MDLGDWIGESEEFGEGEGREGGASRAAIGWREEEGRREPSEGQLSTRPFPLSCSSLQRKTYLTHHPALLYPAGSSPILEVLSFSLLVKLDLVDLRHDEVFPASPLHPPRVHPCEIVLENDLRTFGS